jgi:lipopolysaccharide/colanic/teichoic acid biosynthesis glycosyltransferase
MSWYQRTPVVTSGTAVGHGADLGYAVSWRRQPGRAYFITKRLIDVTGALVVLALLAPFLLLIAAAIRLHSPGPALYISERIGCDPTTGRIRPFRMIKFRSMRIDADSTVHQEHMAGIIRNGDVAPESGCLKMAHDHRITGLGRILRKLSIDELPQLYNVIMGDMSLVGPRPALPYEVEAYKPWHRRRLMAPPGMTGWWQVKGRNCVSFDEGVIMDIYYVEHRSPGMDLKVLLLTPLAVLRGRGAG